MKAFRFVTPTVGLPNATRNEAALWIIIGHHLSRARIMLHSRIALAALLLILSLVACGQSGPLYLPGDPSEVQNLPTQVPELPEEDDDEDDNENDGG